jgi:hypothetical protein
MTTSQTNCGLSVMFLEADATVSRDVDRLQQAANLCLRSAWHWPLNGTRWTPCLVKMPLP